MKRHTIAAVWMGLGLMCGAWAQAPAPSGSSPMGQYNALGVEADVLEAGLDGTMQLLEGHVTITLISDDPSVKPLPIRADKVTFTYANDGSTMPERILLDGNAVIERPEGTLTADHADWDFKKGMLVLTGNPTMNTPTIKDFRGEEIRFDFNNNTIKALKGTMKVKQDWAGESAPAAGGSGEQPFLLRDADIKDWSAFLTAMKEQSAVAGPSAHILGLFDPKEKSAVLTANVEELVKIKDRFLKSLNRVLARSEFYDEDAWKGVAIPDAAAALLKARSERTLDAADLGRMNRLLLEAAYPGLIAPLAG